MRLLRRRGAALLDAMVSRTPGRAADLRRPEGRVRRPRRAGLSTGTRAGAVTSAAPRPAGWPWARWLGGGEAVRAGMASAGRDARDGGAVARFGVEQVLVCAGKPHPA